MYVDVLNEYLILLVKNHPPLKKNDLRNRSYIYGDDESINTCMPMTVCCIWKYT